MIANLICSSASSTARRTAVAGLIIGAVAWPAKGSDTHEITSSVNVFSDRISLNVIVADITAARLCLKGIAPTLHAKEFATEHSRIQRCAADLYVLKRGGVQLTPSAVQMHLSEEKDLFEATITYPAGVGDLLSLEASHLGRLQDTRYSTSLAVTRNTILLGQKRLRADDSSITISLAVQSEAPPPKRNSFMALLHSSIEYILRARNELLLACLLIAAVALLFWLRRKP